MRHACRWLSSESRANAAVIWSTAVAVLIFTATTLREQSASAQENIQNMPPAAESNDSPPQPRRGGQATQRGRQNATFRRAFQPLVEPFGDSIARIELDRNQVALGTIVSRDGLMVTKASQVSDEVQVRLADGRRGTAQVIARDEGLDLALLRSDLRDLLPIDFERIGRTEPGDFLITLGPERDIRFIGIAATGPREFNTGRGRNGSRNRGGFLGVQTAPVESGVGLAITQVVPGSAALRAGLRPGDRLTHIAGTPVESPEQLVSLLSSRNPGEAVEIRVVRDEGELAIVATLGAPQSTAAAQFDRWGGGPFSERRFGFPAVIPHDTPLPPNECGGPVVNTRGEIVGINISRALRVATYALPIDEVQKFVESNTQQ